MPSPSRVGRKERGQIRFAVVGQMITVVVPSEKLATFIDAFGQEFATIEGRLSERRLRPVLDYRQKADKVHIRFVLTEEEAVRLPALISRFAATHSLLDGTELETEED